MALNRADKKLVLAAKDAAKNSYCPYSTFCVGAAIRTTSGIIYTGCNIESCSYGATICAERVALLKAVSEGHREFSAIAIYAPKAPRKASSCGCGLCRQLLAEFGLHLRVIKLRNDDTVLEKTLRQLLPHAFVPAMVKNRTPAGTPETSTAQTVQAGDESRLVRAIVHSLSDDLLKPEYRERTGRNKFTGHCYVASEAFFHLSGGKSSGWIPHVVRHEGGTHWFLYHNTRRKRVDITKRQFRTPVPYKNAKPCGFLTRNPSKRASLLIDRVRKALSD